MPCIPYQRALARMQAGETIMVTHPDPMKKTTRTEYSLSGGVRCPHQLGEASFRRWSLFKMACSRMVTPRITGCAGVLEHD